MPEYNKTKMCAECPFRANALRGWLGPWTVQDFEDFIHKEGVFICHVDLKQKLDQGMTNEEVMEEGEHCVGMLRYMNSVCKLSRDKDKAAAQHRVAEIKDKPLISPFQFRAYHDPLGKQKKGD